MKTNINKSLNKIWGAIKHEIRKDDVYALCDICVAKSQKEIANRLSLPLDKVVRVWDANIDEILKEIREEDTEKQMVCEWY